MEFGAGFSYDVEVYINERHNKNFFILFSLQTTKMSMRINIPKKVAKVSSKPLFEETETLNWNEKMNNAIEDLSENKSRQVYIIL